MLVSARRSICSRRSQVWAALGRKRVMPWHRDLGTWRGRSAEECAVPSCVNPSPRRTSFTCVDSAVWDLLTGAERCTTAACGLAAISALELQTTAPARTWGLAHSAERSLGVTSPSRSAFLSRPPLVRPSRGSAVGNPLVSRSTHRKTCLPRPSNRPPSPP